MERIQNKLTKGYTGIQHIWEGFQSYLNFERTVVIVDLYKVKAKVTLVQALRLCTGRTAYRGSRGIALL
jgi:hypothetical protein